jgi:hypothetical protein
MECRLALENAAAMSSVRDAYGAFPGEWVALPVA